MSRPPWPHTEPDWEDLYEHCKELLGYIDGLEAERDRYRDALANLHASAKNFGVYRDEVGQALEAQVTEALSR